MTFSQSMKKKGPCHPTNPHPPSTALPSAPFLPGATLPLPAMEGEGREGNRIWEVRGPLCCRLLWRPRLPPPLGRIWEGGRGRGGEHRHHRSLRAASTAACGGCCRRHPPMAAPAESGREGGYYGRGASPSSLPFSNQISPQLLTTLELKDQRVANRT